MEVKYFSVGNRKAALYISDNRSCPLIIYNSFDNDFDELIINIKKLCSKDFNLLCISGIDWNHDMSPWRSSPAYSSDSPYTGGADAYLDLITGRMLTEAKNIIGTEPAYTGIAGYSLAGLFALYALYRTDRLRCAASVSGSLWFPGFRDFCINETFRGKPERIYMSLGDREEKTGNPLMRTVRESTEAVRDHYRNIGIDTMWELNRGNHFKNPTLRTAKGIAAII